MRGALLTSLACAGLLGLPLLSGCEREVASERSVDVQSDGTTVTEEKTVTEDRATGDVTVTEEKEVDKPDRGNQ